MGNNTNNLRLNPRVEVRVNVAVFGALADRPELQMVTRDLSVGGALCESSLAVPLGKAVRLRLDLTTEAGAPHPVALEAIPLRVSGNGPYSVAFHFVNAPERVLDLVRRFVLRILQVGS